jgi:hypothetical protein
MSDSDPIRGADGRYLPGRSGNPAGKPPGTRSRLSRITEARLAESADALLSALLGKALEGDRMALKLCIERMAAPMRERPIELALPEAGDHARAALALRRTLDGLSTGDITPGEAIRLIRALADQVEVAGELYEDNWRFMESVSEDASGRVTEKPMPPAFTDEDLDRYDPYVG